MPPLFIGTSAFTAAGWEGAFYPAGMKPAEFLSYYATKFDIVEVDSTFYASPALKIVRVSKQVHRLERQTQDGGANAGHRKRSITHEFNVHIHSRGGRR